MKRDTPYYGSPKALMIILIASVLVIAIIGWIVVRIHFHEDSLYVKQAAVTTNIYRILHLDEVLTLSVHLVAATGDLSYEEQYNKYERELRTLIDETIGMFLNPRQNSMAGKRMLRTAGLSRWSGAPLRWCIGEDGQMHPRFSRPEYLRQKEIYARNMEKTLDAITALNARMVRKEHSYQLVLFIVSLTGLFILFLAWIFTIRKLHKWSTERQQQEELVAESQRQLQVVLDGLDALVYVSDMKTYELLMLNKYGRQVWGDIVGKTCWQTLQSGQTGPCLFCTNAQLLLPGGEPAAPVVWEFQNTVNRRWYECRDQAIRWPDGRLVRMEIATDISERKQFEEERNSLIADLQKALKEIKTLQKILPICSSCKKIRDDTGAWKQLEAYISEHTETEFSHGLCNDCAQKLYPGYYKK